LILKFRYLLNFFHCPSSLVNLLAIPPHTNRFVLKISTNLNRHNLWKWKNYACARRLVRGIDELTVPARA
jgi:hypothetical protein